jgi:hypothetical protein
MPNPTIQNFFGDYATVITSEVPVSASSDNPALIIFFSNFANQEWNALVAGDENNPEKWITAIARRIYDFSKTNTDDIPNVILTAPILGLESRNNTLKRRFSYGLDIYQLDSGSAAPDPDLV